MPSRNKLASDRLSYAHGLFCEDVREEIGGTATYVGVLSGGIMAEGGFPIVLPKLAIVIWIAAPPAGPLPSLLIEIELPGGAVISPGEQQLPNKVLGADPQAAKLIAQLVLKLNNVVLSAAGRIRVTASLDGRKHVACSLHVVGPTGPKTVDLDVADVTEKIASSSQLA